MLQAQPAIILNVDDNEVGRYAKSRVLRAAGFVVYEAATGEEALSTIREVSPQLALINVKLPDMDGVQLPRLIKSDPVLSRILVLQTSATFVQGGDGVRALDDGADSYLVEPVEPGELIANINALLRLRNAEEKVRESERLLRLATSAAGLITWSVALDKGAAPSAEAFTAHIAALAETGPNNNGMQGRLHPEDRARLQAALDAALEAPGQCELEYRNICEDGEVRWVVCQGHCCSMPSVDRNS
jgi:CheY-like chemotaxis protein